MDPPPPPASNQIPATNSVTNTTYAESVESSPRSRTTEPWDDRGPPPQPSTTTGSSKLRLMCSYGGHIIPRPHDKSLCYVGGDTRMVVVDRNTNLDNLTTRLAKTLLHGRAFTLKYQLPNEDLDSLISMTTAEDLENMIDEFDRICAGSSAAKSSRLRVFLFLNNKRESGSSIESILESSVKSEDWFYSALNGSGASGRGFVDTNSVSSLLGLENESESGALNNGGGIRAGNFRDLDDLSKSQQTQNDSLMVETTSSFGSASSSPSLVNLPPVKVRVEEDGGAGVNLGTRVVVGVEEQLAQMSVNGKQEELGFSAMASPPPIPTSLIPAAAVQGGHVSSGVAGGGEFQERIVSDDERSDQGMPVGYGRRQVQMTQVQQQSQSQQQLMGQMQQKPSGIFDIASPDSASSDGSMLYQDSFGQVPVGISSVDSNNARVQVQQKVPESGYVLQTHQLDQQQLQQLQQQQQQQQLQQQQLQAQFIHPGAHYIQHPQNALPISQYYHLYPTATQHSHSQHHLPQLDQPQYPVYFMSPTARQPHQPYNMPKQQAAHNEPPSAAPLSHTQTPPLPTMITNPSAYHNQPRNAPPPSNPEISASVYRTAVAPNNAQPMVQVAPGQQLQQQYVGYSQVHHPPQSMAQAQNQFPTQNPSYAHEYSDPAHAQIYYSQPLAPTHLAQYQTMGSSSPMVILSDASSGQNPIDNMKHQNQNRPSQAQQ